MYIQREIFQHFLNIFDSPQAKGLIVSGVVGCGKTTLVRHVLKELESKFSIFEFSGDDAVFRQAVFADTRTIQNKVRSQTQARALVFVDEIQKSENIFDAIKYAFDTSEISFIVSGSNPDFLNTQAKKRLQRRADMVSLQPFSVSELLIHRGLVPSKTVPSIQEVLKKGVLDDPRALIEQGLTLNREVQDVLDQYLITGGLPLTWLTNDEHERLMEIRKVVERGFESLSKGNDTLTDTIRVELAKLHGREFGYQGLFQKTGIRRRDVVNQVIDDLINHGYLYKKKPIFFDDKRSYLSVFSFCDPGIVTYLTGRTDPTLDLGQRVEGIVHARLQHLLRNHIPLKAQLGYYKPHSVDVNGKVKFKPGEIDFVLTCGDHVVAIEVKATDDRNAIATPILEGLVKERGLTFGLVLYKGVPQWDENKKILYWPYWAI